MPISVVLRQTGQIHIVRSHWMAVLLLLTGAVWYDQVLKPCLVLIVCPLLASWAGVLKVLGLT